MSTSALNRSTGVPQARAADHEADTLATPAPDASMHTDPAPAPGRVTGVLAGLASNLKSRARAAGHAIAHPKRPNLPMELTALSVFKIGTKGRPVLPHQTNVPARDVAVPPPVLSGATRPESLAYARPDGAMRKPAHSMQQALGGFNAHAAGTTPAGGADGIGDPAATAHRCFTGRDPASIDRLVADLRHALASAPGLPTAGHAYQAELLIDALADACYGQPDLARDVLRRLQQGLSIQSQPARDAGFIDNHLTALAWRTAQKLAATASGYDCVHALAGRTWPRADGAARYAPRVWLQAADRLVGTTRCDADSAGVERHARALAGDASATEPAHAAWIVRAASRLWRSQNADGLNASDKGALLAGRQGFFTDGPGTPFAATKSRLARFLNHTIPRATSDRFETAQDERDDAVPVAAQRSAFAAAVRPFGYRKSAVAAMRDGVPGASLGAWSKDEQVLDAALRDAFVAMDEHTAVREPAAGPAKLKKDSRAIHETVGAAELAVLAELSRTPGAGRQSVEYGMTFDDATVGLIAERVVHTLDDATIDRLARRAVQRPGARGSSGSVRSRLREARVRRTLAAFRDTLAGAGRSPQARADALQRVRKHLIAGSDVLDATKIGRWRNHVGDDVPPAVATRFDTIDRIALGKAVKPRGTTTDDYRDAGDRVIDALEGSGKAVVTEGGVIGASTRGISATAASFPWMAPRLNVQASHGRQSVLEFSRSTAAYKIGIGTQRRNRFEAGGGVQVGHNFSILRAAANLEVGHEWDDTEQCTVDLSIARRMHPVNDAYDESAGRRQLKTVNRYLFDNAGRGKSERALWDELGSRFFDNDDFSVAWNNQAARLRKVQVATDLRAGVKIGAGQYSARATAALGDTYQWVRRAELDAVDASGQTKIEGHRVGSGHRAGVEAGINVSVSDQLQNAQAGSADPADVATVSIFSPKLIGVEVPVHDSFHQAKVTLVRERGRLQVRASNADTEFANFTQYKKALRNDPAWLLAFGATPGQPLPAATADYERALAAGRERIEQYLSGIAENRVQNLRFVLRRRLRGHAAREADALDDRIASLRARHRGDPPEHDIDTLLDRRDALLRRADSWLPTELLTVQATDRQITAGLRLGLQIAVQKGARGEHEVAALKLSPREADRLDRNWPRQPEARA